MPIKSDVLLKELQAAIADINGVDSNGNVSVAANRPLTSQEQDTVASIIATHEANYATLVAQNEALAQAAAIALQQGKVYLRQQLLAASPDATTIFNTLQAQVESNPHLLQMVVNQRALSSAAFGWGTLDTGTATGRLRYIMVVQQVIALLT